MKRCIAIMLLVGSIVLSCGCSSQSVPDMNYEIVSQDALPDTARSSERGYEIIKHDAYYLVIHYGEMPVYYPGLDVKGVEVNGDSIKVSVELMAGGMGDAFSYPSAVIKLDRMPKQININNNSYKKLGGI